MLTLALYCDTRTTNLFRKHVGAEILQWELELLCLAAKEDLDNDGRIQRDRHIGRRHHGQVRLTKGNEVRWSGTKWQLQARHHSGQRGVDRGRSREVVEGELMEMRREM
jgi:hypothetical protein